MREFTADERVEILERALALHKVSDLMETPELKLEAHRLGATGFFGTSALAGIFRVSHRTMKRWGFGVPGRGGRFSPNSLSALVLLAKGFRDGKPANNSLVRMCLTDGCNATIVAMYTGYSNYETYRTRENN